MNLDAEIEACIPRLRRYARVLLGGHHASADDLVQDTLERAWRKIHFWRWGSDLRPWLFSIMHNLHVDQSRRGQISTQSLDDTEFEASVPPSQDDMLVIQNLQDALRHLHEDQRTVVLLVAVEQLSYQDVARTLGIPLGTVMSRLSRGRTRLRALMEDCPQTSGQTSGQISGQASPVAISMKIIK
jgi:RNA polymerase sigma factor (sigma-70 family)